MLLSVVAMMAACSTETTETTTTVDSTQVVVDTFMVDSANTSVDSAK